MAKIAVLDPVSEEFAQRWREDFASLDAQVALVRDQSREAVAATAAGAQVLIARYAPVDVRVLDLAGWQLRAIVRLSRWPIGVDLEECARRSVAVHLVPQMQSIPVAEHAMALLLACAKDIVRMNAGVREGRYRERGLTPMPTEERRFSFKWLPTWCSEVHGRTLGVIGFGEIGKEMAQRALAFGMRVIYFDQVCLDRRWEELLGVEYAKLADLLRASDFVTLHIPHTRQTDKLIGASELREMKRTAILVNTCRGGVVDENALVAALRTGQIAGAGLDVFANEPLPADHPLLELENVVLTPHIAGSCSTGRSDWAAQLRTLVLPYLEPRTESKQSSSSVEICSGAETDEQLGRSPKREGGTQ